MKIICKIIFMSFFIILFGANVVFSQETVFELAEKTARTMSLKANNPYDLRVNRPKINSGNRPLGISESDGSNIKELMNLTQGTQRQSINIFAPLAGLADTMNAKVNTDMIDNAMNSPQFAKNTSLILTEASVAGGIDAALRQSYASLMTRYAAQQQFNEQLASHPETREILGRAYNECVSNVIKQKTQGSAAGEDAAVWIAAQSICMGDRSVFNKAKFDSITPSGSAHAGLNFENDPSHSTRSGVAGAVSNPVLPEKISLTDYLFNEAGDKSGSVTGNVSPANLPKYKEDFRRFLGDYDFTIVGAAKGSRNPSSSTATLEFVHRPPTQSFDQWISQKEELIFTAVMKILEKKCYFGNYGKGLNLNKASDEMNIFCSKANLGSLDELAVVSSVDFQLNCGKLDTLYNQFINSNPEIIQYDDSGKKCEVFSKQSLPALQSTPETMKPGHETVATLSYNIALVQGYLTVLYAQAVLNNLSSQNVNGTKNFVSNFANQLIADTVGDQDVYTKYKNTVDALNNNFLPNLIADSAKSSGQSGRLSGFGSDGA